jgi:hypothetical protein
VDRPPRERSSPSPAACLPAGRDPAPPLRAPAACWCVSAFVDFRRPEAATVVDGCGGEGAWWRAPGERYAAIHELLHTGRSLGAASRALSLSRAPGPCASTHPQSLRRCRRSAARGRRPFSKADIRRFGDAAPPEGPILAVRILARRRPCSPRSQEPSSRFRTLMATWPFSSSWRKSPGRHCEKRSSLAGSHVRRPPRGPVPRALSAA